MRFVSCYLPHRQFRNIGSKAEAKKVTCRTGSLELKVITIGKNGKVTCRTGSLENQDNHFELISYLPHR